MAKQNKRYAEKISEGKMPETKKSQVMDGHTPMRFAQEKFYNNELLYPANEVVSVPNEMVERWLRRGGVIIDSDEKLAEVESIEKELSDKKKALEQELLAEQNKIQHDKEQKFVGSPDIEDEE